MNFLLDTQLLLWAAEGSARPSGTASDLIENPDHRLLFSAASLWEVAIKSGLGRADFAVDANLLRRGLLDNDYSELSITSAHAVAVVHLPKHHKDPFDRLLIAQATIEGVLLLTTDEMLARYTGPIQLV